MFIVNRPRRTPEACPCMIADIAMAATCHMQTSIGSDPRELYNVDRCCFGFS